MNAEAAAAHVRSDPARIAAGWTRRFVADRARTLEMVQLYRSLGFETVADPVRPEQMGDACGDCRLLVSLGYCTIYTRGPRTEIEAPRHP